MDCLFCKFINEHEHLFENELAYAMFDGFPINKGHVLVIPKRHAETYFDLTSKELVAMKSLADKVKQYLDKKYNPDGYNIGFNCGEYAGQTIFHCHMHIIPRYKGDIENPRGGVRNILGTKSDY